jgi:hypothetical protein
VAVGGVSSLAAAVVAGLRLVVAVNGHVGRFVVAGSQYTDAARVPAGIPVGSGSGYDGQFYYRMALSPFDVAHRAFGIQMDTAVRFGRIMYPFLAWMAAGTREAAVPWTMVAVNIAGIGALGVMGAVLARDGGRRVWWGLLLPGSFGFLWTLSRDLTEITEAAFLVAGLLALRRQRPGLAAAALTAAVLSRETALVAVGCVAVVQGRDWWRARTGASSPTSAAPGAMALSWIVPIVAFVAWQLVVLARTGHLPATGSGSRNVGVPFEGLARGVSHYGALLPDVRALLWFGELVVMAALVVTAALALRHSGAPDHERLAWVAYVVLALCLAPAIWLGDVGFRSLNDVYALSCLVILASARRPRLIALALAGSWLVVAVELVKFV